MNVLRAYAFFTTDCSRHFDVHIKGARMGSRRSPATQRPPHTTEISAILSRLQLGTNRVQNDRIHVLEVGPSLEPVVVHSKARVHSREHSRPQRQGDDCDWREHGYWEGDSEGKFPMHVELQMGADVFVGMSYLMTLDTFAPGTLAQERKSLHGFSKPNQSGSSDCRP